MRLTDLHPDLWDEGKTLAFDCPTCSFGNGEEAECVIGIPVNPIHESGKAWGMTGTFEDMTITPSIWHHCKSDPHFFIRAGEIVMA